MNQWRILEYPVVSTIHNKTEKINVTTTEALQALLIEYIQNVLKLELKTK